LGWRRDDNLEALFSLAETLEGGEADGCGIVVCERDVIAEIVSLGKT